MTRVTHMLHSSKLAVLLTQVAYEIRTMPQMDPRMAEPNTEKT